jgi:hypothetical protein
MSDRGRDRHGCTIAPMEQPVAAVPICDKPARLQDGIGVHVAWVWELEPCHKQR